MVVHTEESIRTIGKYVLKKLIFVTTEFKDTYIQNSSIQNSSKISILKTAPPRAELEQVIVAL